MTLSERIDELLWDIQRGEYWFLTEEDPDNQYEVVQKALSYELVVRSGHTFELTQKGYEVIESGGFDNWKSGIEKRENEAHRATLDATHYAKQSKNATWISGVFGAVAVLITIYQIWEGNGTDNQLNALTKRVASIDSLLKVLEQSQKSKVDSVQMRKTK